MQVRVIQLSGWIVEKQYGAQGEFVLQELHLRDDHCHGRELLLATRERLAGNAPVPAECNVGSMRAGCRGSPGAIRFQVRAQ